MNCKGQDRSSGVVVSVLITFYNQEACVDRAFGSVVSQIAAFPFEILIGDDGSSDGTWSKIEEWRKRYPDKVRAYQASRDNGVTDPIARASQNRLSLLREARGEYLVFMDGDDYLCSNQKLQCQYDDFASSPDIGSSCHNFEYVDDCLQRTSVAYPESGKQFDISFAQFWNACYLPASCFMFKRPSIDVLEQACPENFDDNSIVYLLAQGRPLRYRSDVMFSYVQQSDSTWNSMDVVKRILVNQRDLLFESSIDYACHKSSLVRHGLELPRLAFVGRKHLALYTGYAEQLGLFQDNHFKRIWSALTEGNSFKSIVCRAYVLAYGIRYGFLKVKSIARFNGLNR